MCISNMSRTLTATALAGFFLLSASAVGKAETGKVEGLSKQPLVVQVESLEEALRFLGRPITRLIKKGFRRQVRCQMLRLLSLFSRF
jgi:hypothetical protein